MLTFDEIRAMFPEEKPAVFNYAKAREALFSVVAENAALQAELAEANRTIAGHILIQKKRDADHMEYAVDSERQRLHWQARAEALERAMVGYCGVCIHEDRAITAAPSNPCFRCTRLESQNKPWQLDEARFSGRKEDTYGT